MRKGWTYLVTCVAVLVAVASLACGSPVVTRTSEPSNGLPPDDQAWLRVPAATDPLDCTDHVPTTQLEQVVVAKWAPDSTRLAVARVIIIPSRLTITGYEEDPVLSVLDIRTGEVRELGQGNKPEWSGTGTFLSYWRNDGYLHIVQGDKNVGTIEVSHPDVRWVGDVMYYWYAEEIRTWDRGVTQTVSRVANDLVPRYPRDDAYFSADGERFTITRYSTDGTTERYIGVTATGEMTMLDEPDITYTEWSPRGQTLLMRSPVRVALRDGDGTVTSALLANLPGPVHGWSSDGRLLLGVLSPTMPAGNSYDQFEVWDGAEEGAFATLPNVFGARTFSPDGRHFTGVSRTGPRDHAARALPMRRDGPHRRDAPRRYRVAVTTAAHRVGRTSVRATGRGDDRAVRPGPSHWRRRRRAVRLAALRVGGWRRGRGRLGPRRRASGLRAAQRRPGELRLPHLAVARRGGRSRRAGSARRARGADGPDRWSTCALGSQTRRKDRRPARAMSYSTKKSSGKQ
jgi:hypothetical protein